MSLPDATPAALLAARQAAGLSQAAAAALVHLSGPMKWSDYERGVRRVDLARWELFLLLTGQHPTKKISEIA